MSDETTTSRPPTADLLHHQIVLRQGSSQAPEDIAGLVKQLNEWSLIPPRYNLSVDREMCKEAADALERLARENVECCDALATEIQHLRNDLTAADTSHEASLREAEDKLAKAQATVAGMIQWLEENQVDVFRRGIYEAADAARQAGKGESNHAYPVDAHRR